MLYNSSGVRVEGYNVTTKALNPGWYYTQTGSPRYYYANGVYYDPATQSYGGSVQYPGAPGPQSMNTAVTPGVPNTGVGASVYAWIGLILSALVAFFGANYLVRKSS
jgi:LPXTG-motif cell wall-anchored protein